MCPHKGGIKLIEAEHPRDSSYQNNTSDTAPVSQTRDYSLINIITEHFLQAEYDGRKTFSTTVTWSKARTE